MLKQDIGCADGHSGYGYGQWYHRGIFIHGSQASHSLAEFSVEVESTDGDFRFVRSILKNGKGKPSRTLGTLSAPDNPMAIPVMGCNEWLYDK